MRSAARGVRSIDSFQESKYALDSARRFQLHIILLLSVTFASMGYDLQGLRLRALSRPNLQADGRMLSRGEPLGAALSWSHAPKELIQQATPK